MLGASQAQQQPAKPEPSDVGVPSLPSGCSTQIGRAYLIAEELRQERGSCPGACGCVRASGGWGCGVGQDLPGCQSTLLCNLSREVLLQGGAGSRGVTPTPWSRRAGPAAPGTALHARCTLKMWELGELQGRSVAISHLDLPQIPQIGALRGFGHRLKLVGYARAGWAKGGRAGVGAASSCLRQQVVCVPPLPCRPEACGSCRRQSSKQPGFHASPADSRPGGDNKQLGARALQRRSAALSPARQRAAQQAGCRSCCSWGARSSHRSPGRGGGTMPLRRSIPLLWALSPQG